MEIGKLKYIVDATIHSSLVGALKHYTIISTEVYDAVIYNFFIIVRIRLYATTKLIWCVYCKLYIHIVLYVECVVLYSNLYVEYCMLRCGFIYVVLFPPLPTMTPHSPAHQHTRPPTH